METVGVRLFIGVWPSSEVSRVLGGLERPPLPAVRWTSPDQWHVTLAFLGEVPGTEVPVLQAALRAAAARAAEPPEAVLGPALGILGRAVLCVPVGGLDDLAVAVRDCLPVGFVQPEAGRGPFRGHLTLARAKGRRRIPSQLAGTPVHARWRVERLCLVGSELGSDGSRYTTVASATVPS